MSYFKLHRNGLKYPISHYGGLQSLNSIMNRNTERFVDHSKMGNRVIPNQNPLVKFLLLFSIDVNWSEDQLISIVNERIQQYSSQCNFVSLYNRGKNLLTSIYPEKNHNTLIVVPFIKKEKTELTSYFQDDLFSLTPLIPIYTTDKTQRWDITKLTDSLTYLSDNELFSIVQMDPYSLIIGYYRWLRLQRGVGESPHAYIASFPLINCYLYHNELVNYNYLNGNNDVVIEKPKWAIENYREKLIEYIQFKHKFLLTEKMKSFTHFVDFNQKTNPTIDVNKLIFPETGKSLFFVQMNWIWTMASLAMVEKYIQYNNIIGVVDGPLKTQLNLYFNKTQLQSQINQIPIPVWKKHFEDIWNRVKHITP